MSGLLSLLLPLLLAPPAAAYSPPVHTLLTDVTMESLGLGAEATPTLTKETADAVRLAIDTRARSHPDAAIRDAWARRYPTPESFDAWAFKEFLLFSPAQTVIGIDTFTVADAPTLRALAAAGSRQPDDDFRNRDRLAYDAQRQPIKDAAGNPVPFDPALLNIGKLGFLSSQAHAHYALPIRDFSDDPKVLQTEPDRFGVAAGYPPGPILTIAAEMSQIHTDLALLAGLSGRPDARAMAWLYQGQALHYVEDASNPVHNSQVGVYDFFVDAFKGRLLLSAKTGGGYLGELRSLASIGIDIITNHHVMSEELTRKRLVEAATGEGTKEAEAILAAIQKDDPDFAASLAPLLGQPHPEQANYAEQVVRALSEAGAKDAATLFRLTRAIAEPRYREAGVIFDYDHEDPDSAFLPPDASNAADYAAFWQLQQRSLTRGTTATRVVSRLTASVLDAPPEQAAALQIIVLDRLITRQLRLIQEAEARRADYLAHPPDSVVQPERMPAMLAGEIVALGGLIGGGAYGIRRMR